MSDTPGPANPAGATAFGGFVWYAYDDGLHGRELWRTDGTVAGTSMFVDINPGTAGSQPAAFVASGAFLFFTADDGVHGTELWATDGTFVALVADLQPGSAGSFPQALADSGGLLYFSADDGSNGRELWTSDGSAGGTYLVKDIAPGQVAFFPPFSSNPSWLVDVGGVLYFSASDGTNGVELWTSDGTAFGTTIVRDLYPGQVFGPNSSVPEQLTAVNGVLFFRATDGVSGYELYRSLGTAGSTVRVADIRPGSASGYPDRLTAVGTTLFFTADDGVHGIELWRCDSPYTSASMVADINAGANSSAPSELRSVGNGLLFAADDGSHGVELWQATVSPNGAALVKDINPGAASSNPRGITAMPGCGGAIFAANGGGGAEPWRTDGTAAGTNLIQKLRPGPVGSLDGVTPGFTPLADRVVFAANDGGSGVEPWFFLAGNVATGGARFTTDPVSASVFSGSSLTLTVAVSSPTPVTLQWRRNQGVLNGEVGTSLTIPAVTNGTAGVYDVVATNACGSSVSAGAVVTVAQFTLIFDQPFGSLSVRADNQAGSPGALYFTSFSTDLTNASAPGAGPWFGMFIDLNDLVQQFQFGFPPFVGILDPSGGSQFSLPAGSLAPVLIGYRFWAVTVMADLAAPGGPMIIGASNVANLLVQ